MSDNEPTDTDERTEQAPVDETGADPRETPDGTAPEALSEPETPLEEEEPAVEEQPTAQVEEPPVDEASSTEDPVRSPFGAEFSNPEPTAVVARPRRRATRPVAAPDPDAVEPVAAPAAAVPAFISFVAPAADDVPAPARRRSRRPAAETPEEPEEIELVDDSADEDEAPPSRSRSRSRRRSGGRATADVDAAAEVEDTDD